MVAADFEQSTPVPAATGTSFTSFSSVSCVALFKEVAVVI